MPPGSFALLKGMSVAISVSTCEDLADLGYLDSEIARALGAIVKGLIFHGADIHYGGDLRSDELNFTTVMARDAAALYRSISDVSREAVFVHHVALSVWSRWCPEVLFRHAMALADFGLIKLYRADGTVWRVYSGDTAAPPMHVIIEDGEPREPGGGMGTPVIARGPSDLARLWIGEPFDVPTPAASLSVMRRGMARDGAARIIIGGRTRSIDDDGIAGVAEEALASLAERRLILPAASYGGCGHDIAVALGLIDGPRLRRPMGPAYVKQLAQISQRRDEHRKDLEAVEVSWDTLQDVMLADSAQSLAPAMCRALGRACHAMDRVRHRPPQD